MPGGGVLESGDAHILARLCAGLILATSLPAVAQQAGEPATTAPATQPAQQAAPAGGNTG